MYNRKIPGTEFPGIYVYMNGNKIFNNKFIARKKNMSKIKVG